MAPVVYRITNENCGRFYIGSTKDFNDRVKSHTAQFIGKAHHNKQMQEDYNKGDSFKFDVLFILDTREDAFEYEESLLNKFRGNVLLYNIGRNARGGDNITDNPRREAIIEQMRRSIIERYAKMSAARIGIKPVNAKTISINGTIYGSYHEASAKLNVPVVTIRWRVLSKNPKYAEWKFA